jgi:hypothetical protein
LEWEPKGNAHRLPAGSQLKGEGVYFIIKGWAITYDLSEGGTRQILSFRCARGRAPDISRNRC